jgi:DNA-binding protein
MEAVEKKTELSGAEKKKTAMAILKSFMENRVNNWLELEKLISKAIDFASNVSKNGINKVVISSITISDTKAVFNLIYSSTMTKINEKYPLADDIINNLFDITKYVLELIEGQTQMKENEKKILLKKILNHIVNTVSVGFTDEQKILLKSNIDSTVSLITIGWRSIESGKLNVRPEEVISIFTCCFQWISKCFKKKSSEPAAPVAATVEPEVVGVLIATPTLSEPIDSPIVSVDVPVEIELEKESTNSPTILV